MRKQSLYPKSLSQSQGRNASEHMHLQKNKSKNNEYLHEDRIDNSKLATKDWNIMRVKRCTNNINSKSNIKKNILIQTTNRCNPLQDTEKKKKILNLVHQEE